MRFPRLKTCCCCFSVKTGAKVIGWTSLVGRTFLLLHELLGGPSIYPSKFIWMIYRAIEMQFYIHNIVTMSPDENLGPDMDKAIGYMRMLQGIFLLVIIFQTIQCAFTVSFLVAVYRKNPKPLLHWLLKWFIIFILEQIVNFLMIFLFDGMTDDDLPAAIKFYCISIFHLYYMWVVYSFYLDIRDRTVERDAPEVTSSGVRDHTIQDDDYNNRQRLNSVENQSETSIFIVETSKTQPRNQEYTDINI